MWIIPPDPNDGCVPRMLAGLARIIIHNLRSSLDAALTDKEHYRERLEKAQVELQSHGKGGFENMKIEQQEQEIQALKEQRSLLLQENEALKAKIAELEAEISEACDLPISMMNPEMGKGGGAH